MTWLTLVLYSKKIWVWCKHHWKILALALWARQRGGRLQLPGNIGGPPHATAHGSGYDKGGGVQEEGGGETLKMFG